MFVKHYFKAYSVQKQTKRKFSIFDQNHGLNPLKKNLVWHLCKINFLIVFKGLFSKVDDDQILFHGLFCAKTNVMEISNFLTKIMP